VQFNLKKMQQENVQQIASWHYPTPYDFYDADQDQEDLAELLDTESWQEFYYSVF
jgi:[ribosomal protein S18]-alanine N-acetyltransferase